MNETELTVVVTFKRVNGHWEIHFDSTNEWLIKELHQERFFEMNYGIKNEQNKTTRLAKLRGVIGESPYYEFKAIRNADDTPKDSA